MMTWLGALLNNMLKEASHIIQWYSTPKWMIKGCYWDLTQRFWSITVWRRGSWSFGLVNNLPMQREQLATVAKMRILGEDREDYLTKSAAPLGLWVNMVIGQSTILFYEVAVLTTYKCLHLVLLNLKLWFLLLLLVYAGAVIYDFLQKLILHVWKHKS